VVLLRPAWLGQCVANGRSMSPKSLLMLMLRDAERLLALDELIVPSNRRSNHGVVRGQVVRGRRVQRHQLLFLHALRVVGLDQIAVT